ncbi:MAG TPA: aminotransferase class I/II-fold pyridoxal phosphate-dependent enzyme [Jatrophihabitans sp.]|jgi:bifunctional pyridoxal-dependent enzyme with beta-cystathionase and maltose regulon repressor activities|nr:aminotransferase class I/II-fold pyridoxal phosphate-dependent enzyme [Jatrophihabitans sp.]
MAATTSGIEGGAGSEGSEGIESGEGLEGGGSIEGGRSIAVSVGDYRYFIERAVRGMAAILDELGDESACRRPALPGANTPYGLLTHCLGVLDYWGGELIAGRPVQRDRAAEFEARGTVAELRQRVEPALAQLAQDLSSVDGAAPLRCQPESWAVGPDRPLNQAAALLHIYEEMAQHRGQLEVLRDVLLADGEVAQPTARPDGAAGSPFHAPIGWLRGKRGVKWQRPGPEQLPAWIADMDFAVAPAVQEAIQDALRRGDLGYPDWPAHPLAEPFAQRMATRYGWQPEPGAVRGVCDLIQALQIVLQLGSQPGQAVLAHTPNYPPFLATVQTMGRRLVAAPLQPAGSSWAFDADRLAEAAARADPAILLLVNPQNPTGRVFRRSELEQLAELAERLDLLVVSDEIHADLTHGSHRHIPFASLSAGTAARTVTITSATKAFNFAGLRTAVAHVGPPALRAAWDSQPPDLFGAPNVLGVEATLAAWRHGDGWLAGLRAELAARRAELVERIEAIPGISMRAPEAGYLAWLDCRDAGLPAEPADFFSARAGVQLSPGLDFGPGTSGHARLNFATTAAVLEEMLTRMAEAVAGAAG